MHLTNYSVNKHNERFERNETEDKGSKRSIKWFTEFLQANQHDVSKFWNDISVRLFCSVTVTFCNCTVFHQHEIEVAFNLLLKNVVDEVEQMSFCCLFFKEVDSVADLSK